MAAIRTSVVASVVVLSGCNAIFGLHDVTQRDAGPIIDAQVFDAPIDAPFTCPPIGVTPTFRRAVHSLPFAACGIYSISVAANRALAYCRSGASTSVVSEGELEQPLSPITTVDMPGLSYYVPRLGADGDLLARVFSTGSMAGVEIQKRDAPLTWSFSATLPYSVGLSSLIGAPVVSNISRGPEPHVVVHEQRPTGNLLVELARVAGTWQQVDSYSSTTIATLLLNPSLSADGLRMVFVNTGTVMYTDRPTVHDRFRPAEPIPDIELGLEIPVIDDNCGKLYFTAIDNVFYLER